MAILPILVAPDPRLNTRAEPVDAVTDDIRTLMDNMLETMYAAPGIGLAANQVGVLKRILVIDLGQRGETEKPADWPDDYQFYPSKPLKMANPEIIWESEEWSVCQEGCLSVPGEYDDVERPNSVVVKYLDENNKEQELKAEGLLAACVQHEIDHLNGTLFVDHLSRLKRNRAIDKLRKAKKSQKLDVKYPVAK
jgi:peptide deformylase